MKTYPDSYEAWARKVHEKNEKKWAKTCKRFEKFCERVKREAQKAA